MESNNFDDNETTCGQSGHRPRDALRKLGVVILIAIGVVIFIAMKTRVVKRIAI
jgi:hypothetical protein